MMSGWLGHYSFRCQPVDYSYSPMALRVSILGLIYQTNSNITQLSKAKNSVNKIWH